MPNMPYRVVIAYYLGRKEQNAESTFMDNLICFMTNSKYSHAELVYDYSPVSNVGLCWSSSPRDGGVRSTRIDFSSRHWELYEVPSMYSTEQLDEWFKQHHGAKYDWLGALGAYISIFRGADARFFCTEIIGKSMGIAGADRMSPQEFFTYNQMVGHKRLL